VYFSNEMKKKKKKSVGSKNFFSFSFQESLYIVHIENLKLKVRRKKTCIFLFEPRKLFNMREH